MGIDMAHHIATARTCRFFSLHLRLLPPVRELVSSRKRHPPPGAHGSVNDGCMHQSVTASSCRRDGDRELTVTATHSVAGHVLLNHVVSDLPFGVPKSSTGTGSDAAY